MNSIRILKFSCGSLVHRHRFAVQVQRWKDSRIAWTTQQDPASENKTHNKRKVSETRTDRVLLLRRLKPRWSPFRWSTQALASWPQVFIRKKPCSRPNTVPKQSADSTRTKGACTMEYGNRGTNLDKKGSVPKILPEELDICLQQMLRCVVNSQSQCLRGVSELQRGIFVEAQSGEAWGTATLKTEPPQVKTQQLHRCHPPSCPDITTPNGKWSFKVTYALNYTAYVNRSRSSHLYFPLSGDF